MFIIVFFPHLIAGPVVLQEHLLPQVRAKQDWRLRADQLALVWRCSALASSRRPCWRTTSSLCGRDLHHRADHGGGDARRLDGRNRLQLQIYFDFSGYSDMAVGLAFLWAFACR